MLLRFDSKVKESHYSQKRSYTYTIFGETLSPRRLLNAKSAARKCSVKKVFLNSFFFNKVAGFTYFLDETLKPDKHC